MPVLSRTWKPLAAACLLLLPAAVWAQPDESSFLELRVGSTLIASNVDFGDDDELDTYSIAYGVQSRHLAFLYEHSRTREDVRYHTNAVMMQIEGDSQLDGLGFFARLGLINVSLGSPLNEDTEEGFGIAFGGGLRYQFSTGHRIFFDTTVQNSDLANVSLGLRLPL